MRVKNDSTEQSKDGLCLASFVFIGALCFPVILFVSLILGYSILGSLLFALFLAMPVTVGVIFLLRVFTRG